MDTTSLCQYLFSVLLYGIHPALHNFLAEEKSQQDASNDAQQGNTYYINIRHSKLMLLFLYTAVQKLRI